MGPGCCLCCLHPPEKAGPCGQPSGAPAARAGAVPHEPQRGPGAGLARLRAKDARSITGFTAETVAYFLCSLGRVFEGETHQTLGL